ncbi:MAG: lytic murein transglycosylase B [Acidobacteria bacterium]|nr:MAG: lytic murein transglycosylase B [Acidobacteriota bacterium]
MWILELFLVATVAATAPSVTPAPPPLEENSVNVFIDEMAAKHGFDRGELERVFGRIRPSARILELMDRQAKRKPWQDYRALFVNPEKITHGFRFWRNNADKLTEAREKYGVPEEVIIAVIGVETHYGRNTGRFRVLEALTTLAFDYPKRSKMFRLELEHYLLLAREETMALATPRGSYAGAMGIAQFMPGSYRRYAIDFDGDGKRDLFENASDAIGSVANYLTAHGWQRGEPVAVPATVESSAASSFEASNLSTRVPLEELRNRGITVSGSFPAAKEAILLSLHNREGAEYWLGFDNFYVITRYNNSVYYAMAVYQLSRELRKHHDARAAAGDR